jgi:hypothetical protein
MSAKLRLGLPNLSHVFEAMVLLNCVLFFNSFSLPRVRRCVELRACKFWFSHSSSLQISLTSLHTECEASTTVGTTALSTDLVAACVANTTVALHGTKPVDVVFEGQRHLLTGEVEFVTCFQITLAVEHPKWDGLGIAFDGESERFLLFD